MSRPALPLGLPLVLLALAAGCGDGNGGGAIVATGHCEATEVRLSAKVGGTLAAFDAEEGDAVAAGQAVAAIDPVDIELALQTARAERGQADAEWRLRVAGPRREEIAEARARVDQASADLAGAEREFARMEELLASGSGTTKARDDAGTRRDIAREALAAARQRLRLLEAGTRREEIDAARARVDAADARIAQLEQQLADATIEAPLAARLTHKLVEAGEIVAPGAPLAVLTDLGDIWLNAYVGELDLGALALGQPVRVVTDDGQEREGTISYIAADAQFTPKNVQTREERVQLVYLVKVRLPNDDGLFKPGMPATAHFTAAAGAASAKAAR